MEKTVKYFNSSKVRYKLLITALCFLCYYLFQFLQGTVQTVFLRFHEAFINIFQFLQGTVQTMERTTWKELMQSLFQFLQGTVQTSGSEKEH